MIRCRRGHRVGEFHTFFHWGSKPKPERKWAFHSAQQFSSYQTFRFDINWGNSSTKIVIDHYVPLKEAIRIYFLLKNHFQNRKNVVCNLVGMIEIVGHCATRVLIPVSALLPNEKKYEIHPPCVHAWFDFM